MKAKCNKTLVHGDGTTSFKKGESYDFHRTSQSDKITENTRLLNEQGDEHNLGIWAKHFKLVK